MKKKKLALSSKMSLSVTTPDKLEQIGLFTDVTHYHFFLLNHEPQLINLHVQTLIRICYKFLKIWNIKLANSWKCMPSSKWDNHTCK